MSFEKITDNNRNGFGLKSYLGVNLTHELKSRDTLFVEKSEILKKSTDKRIVLLEGQPGSGKSEIIQSIIRDCFLSQTSFFSLKLHVNAGKGEGIKNVASSLDEYLTHTSQYAGNILLDNCDYIGYRGHRSLQRAEEYSSDFLECLNNLVKPDILGNNTIIGTIHPELWRVGQWQWPEGSLILKNAHEVLSIMKEGRTEFLGKIALHNFVSILIKRGLSDDAAHLTALDLDGLGLADYAHAKLLDLRLLEQNRLGQALNEFNIGRSSRMISRRCPTN